MALPNELHPLQLGAGSASGYQIEQSLRFDGFSYLTRTPTAYGGGRIFTHSAWVKKTTNGGYETLITAYNGSNADDTIRFDASDKFKFFLNDTSDGNVDTVSTYKDPSALYHVVTAVNISTQTVKQYVNGVDVTGSVSIPSGQFVSSFNQSGKQNAIGRRLAANNYYFDGYMAEVYWIDNQFLDQYDFGEFDDAGVWRPIEYTGT